jgi:hypothetical protein
LKAALVKEVTTGMTVGAPVYLSKTAGGYTQDISGYTIGDLAQILGYAENTTDVMVVDATAYALVTPLGT